MSFAVRGEPVKEIPVTYVLYADEGHGFGRAPNLDSFLAISEVFLGECLGGRSEDFGTAFEKSSATVPHGIEFVPGLKEALEEANDDEARSDPDAADGEL